MSIETAFASVALPERDGKPRNQGLTMMIDWGLPVAHQKDVTDTVGHLREEGAR